MTEHEREQRLFQVAAENGYVVERVPPDENGRCYIVTFPLLEDLDMAEVLVGVHEGLQEVAGPPEVPFLSPASERLGGASRARDAHVSDAGPTPEAA